MELLLTVIFLIILAFGLVSLISLIYPLSVFYLTNRKRAAIALIGSLIILSFINQLTPSMTGSPDITTHEEFKKEWDKEMVKINESRERIRENLKEIFK